MKKTFTAGNYATVDQLREKLRSLGFTRINATEERWTLDRVTVTIREDHIALDTPEYRREFVRGKGGLVLAIEALNAM